jgi:hypothetical protein
MTELLALVHARGKGTTRQHALASFLPMKPVDYRLSNTVKMPKKEKGQKEISS